MPTPRGVKKQADEADRLIQEQGEPPEADTDPENPAEPTGEEPTGKPQKAEEPEGGEPTGEDPAGPAKPESNDDADTWRKRYESLKGKYDAEVPRLHAEVNRLQRRSDDLEQQVQKLRSEGTQLPEGKFLTDEERDEWGEWAEPVERTVARAVAPLREEIQSLRKEYREERQVDADTLFWRRLNELVPDWEQINNDSEFHKYLDGVEEFSGETRQALLEKAHAQGDADRVARFFTDWKGRQRPEPDPDDDPNAQRRDPSRQVQPDTTPGGGSEVPAGGGEVWTQRQIRQFYKDKSSGVYRGREDEARAIEQRIFAAQNEGRVRPG